MKRKNQEKKLMQRQKDLEDQTNKAGTKKPGSFKK